MQWNSVLVARSPSCTIADHQMQQQQQLDGSASITITNNNSWQQQTQRPPPPAQLDIDMCDADVFPERASATSRAPRSPEWHEKPSRSTAAANKQEAILWPQPLANAHLTQRILFFCASFPCAVRHGFEPVMRAVSNNEAELVVIDLEAPKMHVLQHRCLKRGAAHCFVRWLPGHDNLSRVVALLRCAPESSREAAPWRWPLAAIRYAVDLLPK